MLRITGCLRKVDRELLREAAHYTLDYLMTADQRLNSHIHIHVGPPAIGDERDKASCTMNVNSRGTRCISIWINPNTIRPRCRKLIKRMEETLKGLMHELVHTKQYLTGELVDVSAEYCMWRGERIKEPAPDDNDGYYSLPSEIDAYGREVGLWDRFKRHYDGEC